MQARVSDKTALTGAAGAAVVVLIYLCSLFGLELPAEVAGAVVTVAMFIIAYTVPAKQGKYVDVTVPDDADLLINRENVSPDEFEDEVA